jgi:HK97 family phage major capsid protein
MPSIKQLEEQTKALVQDQEALVADTTRTWSDKREEWENREQDIKAVLSSHHALKSVDSDPLQGQGDQPTRLQTPKSIGEQFTDALQTQAPDRAPGRRMSAGVDASFQNATITEAGGGIGGVVPQYLPGGPLPLLFRRLTVSDLIPQGSTTSQSIIYVQETAVTNAAATVAEGAAKPQSDLTLAQVTEVVRKIATTAKISDEMVNDVGYIQSYVNGRLVLFVQLAEEDQLLNGNGTAPNLRGILQRSGLTSAQALGADTRPDAIFKEITKIRAGAFLEPDAIVVHPTDWQTIRLLKDGNGQYYGGGPFGFAAYGNAAQSTGSTTNLAAGNDTLWNMRVVVTPAIAQGTALVGAFGLSSQVYRREGIRVEMTNSNEDDFLKNLIAIRVEERLALAVYRPAGFGTVTGL